METELIHHFIQIHADLQIKCHKKVNKTFHDEVNNKNVLRAQFSQWLLIYTSPPTAQPAIIFVQGMFTDSPPQSKTWSSRDVAVFSSVFGHSYNSIWCTKPSFPGVMKGSTYCVAIAEYEKRFNKNCCVYTINIDIVRVTANKKKIIFLSDGKHMHLL